MDIGPEVAKSIHDWLQKHQNLKLLDDLFNLGVKIVDSGTKSSKLSGQTFLFTGALDISRDQAKDLVRRLGGKILSNVSQNLDYLIIGNQPGSKLKQAQNLNVKILTEKEFLKLIK